MSVTFFISPFEPKLWQSGQPEPTSSLHIDFADYRENLLARWPHTREYDSALFAGGVHWSIDSQYVHGADISLDTTCQHVACGRGGANWLEFILWHREYVPDEHKLYLYHTSDVTDTLLLAPDTTKQQLADFIGLLRHDFDYDFPLNGMWDGFLGSTAGSDPSDYRTHLQIFVYATELEGSLGITGRQPGIAALYTELMGSRPSLGDVIELARHKTRPDVTPPPKGQVQHYTTLRLRYRQGDGERDQLVGDCLRIVDGRETILGPLTLARRGLYENPPV
jgi:hypothetical protein